MSIENRIKVIAEATTESDAIAAYGKFVEYFEGLTNKMNKGVASRSGDRGWTRQRLMIQDIKLTPNQAQEILANRWGFDTLNRAITEHPFK